MFDSARSDLCNRPVSLDRGRSRRALLGMLIQAHSIKPRRRDRVSPAGQRHPFPTRGFQPAKNPGEIAQTSPGTQ